MLDIIRLQDGRPGSASLNNLAHSQSYQVSQPDPHLAPAKLKLLPWILPGSGADETPEGLMHGLPPPPQLGRLGIYHQI